MPQPLPPSIKLDNKGMPYVTQSTIYLFNGAKTRDFHSMWVQQDIIVFAPPKHSIHIGSPAQEVVELMEKKGYHLTII